MSDTHERRRGRREAGGRDRHDRRRRRSTRESITDAAPTAPSGGLRRLRPGNYIARVRGGDMGSLPAVGGLIVLGDLVLLRADRLLLSLCNFGQHVHRRRRRRSVMAMGLVFVLLLGEIDLSAGVTSGVGAAVMARAAARTAGPGRWRSIAAIVVGVVIGYLHRHGMRAKVRMPSFVVTLALFLASRAS